MPVRVYECKDCEHVEEHFFHSYDIEEKDCPGCGKQMARPVRVNTGQPHPWKPITLEHIADEPMRFETQKQLRDYCRKHKVSSGALL